MVVYVLCKMLWQTLRTFAILCPFFDRCFSSDNLVWDRHWTLAERVAWPTKVWVLENPTAIWNISLQVLFPGLVSRALGCCTGPTTEPWGIWNAWFSSSEILVDWEFVGGLDCAADTGPEACVNWPQPSEQPPAWMSMFLSATLETKQISFPAEKHWYEGSPGNLGKSREPRRILL